MGRTYSYKTEWSKIAERINQMHSLIDSKRFTEFERYGRFAIQHKEIYIRAEQETRVPYPLIAAIHRREEPSFDCYLGNGQPLNQRTTIEPENRGPFCRTLPATVEQFIAGCRDALAIDGLSAVLQQGDIWEIGSRWGSWPIEKMIFFAERLNGLGYWFKGIPSPYIWGGTNIQVAGKYIRDGVFDSNHWDEQPGVAAILWMIGYLDPSVHFTRET